MGEPRCHGMFTSVLEKTVPYFAFCSPIGRGRNLKINDRSHIFAKEVSAYVHERPVTTAKHSRDNRQKGLFYENQTPNSETTSAKSTERSFVEAKTPPAFSLSRRIGSTYYTVNVHFSDNAKQTMEDKLLHMIRNETVDISEDCGMKGQVTFHD